MTVSSKPPKKLKLSRSALRSRSETPTPKPKSQKKSSTAKANYVRNRNIPKPTERKECLELMVTVAGQHQTKGKSYTGIDKSHVTINIAER